MPFLNLGGTTVWWTILLGAIFTIGGAVVRLIPTMTGTECDKSSLKWLHIGQCLNGIAGPAFATTASAISTTWFSPSERVTATSIAYMSAILGPGCGFIAAQFVRHRSDFKTLLYVEAGMAIAGLVMWIFCPKLPKYAPSKTADAGRHHEELEELTSRH
eukprot:UN25162